MPHHRGVRGVQLVTSDAHKGLVRAIEEVFQGASWQRCVVHLMRDCMREAGSRQLKRRVGRMLSPVFRAKDAATAQAMYHVACDMLRDCCPKAAVVAEEAEPDALAYLGFPPSHWKRLCTNNVQKRANHEIKRRATSRSTRCRSSTTKGAPRRRPPLKSPRPSSWKRRER